MTRRFTVRPKADPQPSLAERLRRAGRLGCVKGTPADLSTNKDHMRGFGAVGARKAPEHADSEPQQ